jgi:hypothetical protein
VHHFVRTKTINLLTYILSKNNELTFIVSFWASINVLPLPMDVSLPNEFLKELFFVSIKLVLL